MNAGCTREAWAVREWFLLVDSSVERSCFSGLSSTMVEVTAVQIGVMIGVVLMALETSLASIPHAKGRSLVQIARTRRGQNVSKELDSLLSDAKSSRIMKCVYWIDVV